VVVSGVVLDRVLAHIRYDDRGDVTATRVGTTATSAGLTLVGEVVLIPGDHDGIAALPPLFRGHDLAHRDTHVRVAG
jgi:hypothetical protein